MKRGRLQRDSRRKFRRSLLTRDELTLEQRLENLDIIRLAEIAANKPLTDLERAIMQDIIDGN